VHRRQRTFLTGICPIGSFSAALTDCESKNGFVIVAPANRSHDLDPLIAGLEAIVARDRSERLPSWVKNRLDEFAKLDPQSFSLRYAKDKENKDFIMPSEWWVELQALRKVMDVMCRGFERLIQVPA
jgi:hypothetical protein